MKKIVNPEAFGALFDCSRDLRRRSFIRRRNLHGLARWIFLFMLAIPNLNGREKRKEDFGFGLSIEVPAPESEVLQGVEEVVNDGIIQGSKEYNKDQYIEKATATESFASFPQWTEPGKVFYKVRTKVLAPINFKDSGDQGTLAVRYIVSAKAPDKTDLRIDAVYVDDFHRGVHPSNGSVEGAEYRAIQDHIDGLELKQKQETDAEKRQQEDVAKQALVLPSISGREASRLAVAQASSETLEQRVQDLRREVERTVKSSGTTLKTAPFRTATNVATLAPGTVVAVLVVTPYWYGVENEQGQHGWVRRDQVGPLP